MDLDMKLNFNFNKISKCGNYAYANINNKNVALHRIITNTINELDKIHNPIDHINGGFVGNLGLSKKLWNKYVEVGRKYKTDTDKMKASDYTHLFGYLNPYYRAAYSIPKRKR